MPLETSRSDTSQRSTARPAGFRPETGRSSKQVGKHKTEHIHTTHCSGVPLGKNMVRKSEAARPGHLGDAAGQSSMEKASESRKTGYAWGEKDKANNAVRKSFADAAGGSRSASELKGAVPGSPPKPPQSARRPAQKNNFHIGLTSDQAKPGVYDFHPSSQGRKARSAPRRRSQAGELIHSHSTKAGGGTDTQYEAAFTGAAGVRGGHWADARYASTTCWA